MKHKLAILILWGIAIVTTALLSDKAAAFTYLGPLYAICAIGSVMVVHRAGRKS